MNMELSDIIFPIQHTLIDSLRYAHTDIHILISNIYIEFVVICKFAHFKMGPEWNRHQPSSNEILSILVLNDLYDY